MRRTPSLNRALFGFLLLASPFLQTTRVHAQTTTWVGSVGDWGTVSNWSNGEPNAGLDAEILAAATPTVTQTGEICRSFTNGINQASTLRVNSGSLNVLQRLHLGSAEGGVMQQFGGSVTAGELVMGNPEAAASYTLSGGSLTVGTALIGDTATGASGFFTMTASNPILSITGSLRIAETSTFGCGAGTMTVGTTSSEGVFLDGAFTLNNNPSVSLTGLTMSGTGTLSVAVGFSGVSTMMVSGPATLAGQLLVTDIGAANGTYEVLRGNPLQGTFDAAFLSPDWSWRVEGNSLLLTKGVVTVESAHWSRLKRPSAP